MIEAGSELGLLSGLWAPLLAVSDVAGTLATVTVRWIGGAALPLRLIPRAAVAPAVGSLRELEATLRTSNANRKICLLYHPGRSFCKENSRG